MLENPLDFFDFTEEEGKESLAKVEKFANRDGRICVCGHSIGFHSFIEVRGLHICNALKQGCPCKMPRPVIDSANTRHFMRKTHGGGGLHALSQGVNAAVAAGTKIEWIVEQKCDRCGAESPVSPVPVSQTGSIRTEATGYDALLCRDCRGL